MKLQFSKAMSKLFGDKKEVHDYLHKLGFIEVMLKWVIDSKIRRAVYLHRWCKEQLWSPQLQTICHKQDFAHLWSPDLIAKAVVRFWKHKGRGGMTYVSDKTNWGMNEYWATIEEILAKLKDDCDGFANLIYHTCRIAGIPANRLYIVAGNVVGGGHAYVVYRASNGLEYALDGCYWPDQSEKLDRPYALNSNYRYGQSEWFRFNEEGIYKVKV